jgi:hypothetical protein
MSSQDEVSKMKKRNTGFVLFLLLLMFYFSPQASAQPWIEDFDKICSQAEDADSLPTAKLKELVMESDKLLGVIEAGNDPRKKVYIFRLRKCRNLFVYVMDLREAEAGAGPKK